MADLKVTVPEESQNILGVATISAPLENVFRAHVDPELFARWWCRGHTMAVRHFDCRDGGYWHVVEMVGDGEEHEFIGTFHEVARDERIVQTFEYLGLPERGQVMLERADFVRVDRGTTEIRTLATAQSREARDAMVASGMEGGWQQSIGALGRLVEVQGRK
ncbi:MAG: SRPBCC domain-containing protein [Gammaproteobacteria bacterium]